MSKHKKLKRNLLICLLAGSAVIYTLPLHAATSVVANNALPQGGHVVAGDIQIPEWAKPGGSNPAGNLEMNITQNSTNGVISWGSFDVGGSATVNFNGPQGGYNTLNYVNGGNMSQIYGTINANNNGNIFIVNPAGVQIGPSAQINVGSLYVSSNTLDDTALSNFYDKAHTDNFILGGNRNTDAALMSLGNINANKVTFEGDGRIVIDSERLINGDDPMGASNINIKTAASNIGNIVIGYDGYNETTDSYNTAGTTAIAKVNGQDFAQNQGYMWVEDVKQLQAIGKNEASLTGNYALRNSIDATGTEQGGFKAIGSHNNAFKGNFDGIDYNIFGLNIDNNGKDYAGLFGVTDGAVINNVTLVGGSVSGGSDVGAIVGYANNTTISNVVNSASVTGEAEVGGIVGTAINSTITNAVNTGKIESVGETLEDGSTLSNVGGLVGYMSGSNLDGNSYNLGDVSGDGYNVGGLVGHAVNSTIGDGTNLVYNRMDVTGAYNVGGIVGNMTASTVRNAENSGTVLASGSLTDEYNYHTDIANENNLPAGSSLSNGIVSIDVNVANAGGIAGSSSDSSIIKDVTNTGDVSSRKQEGTENINGQNYNYEYYTAGNVGGIVGSAADTNITNATNRENEIRGAHNVGGVVGYFSGNGTIDKGINDGGDIMATGARNGNVFVMESVRQSGDEDFIIGNIGGIVGYMEGNDVKVTGSANRGTVHTENIEDADNVLTISKAANVGGIVGKIDANTNETELLTDFRNGNYKNASVSNSYNTGNVTGYTGVGGVIGMMYNGSVAGSYNQGAINTTRQVDRGGGSTIDPLNMGGIVGDTTEQTSASAVIYDVYNEGQIGDEDFEFYARHVGGIVGRLSGTVEKAYNTGDIYNNDTAVGGIVGWWYNGNIKNVFNTGNITVRSATELQVGGIAGAAEGRVKSLENAYNLGTIRGYKEGVDASNNPINGTDDDIYVGGIIGRARGGNELTIRNVYTMGNLYAGVGTYNNATGTYSYKFTNTNGLGAIYGGNVAPILQGANYIKPDSNYFKNLSGQNKVNDIEYGNRYIQKEYEFVNVGEQGDKIFSNQDGGAVNNATDNNWRIYEDSTTPILNAFLPNVEDYFGNDNNMTNISTIQYGTAYNPLLTIIKANGDLSYDWNKLGISGAASLAVYGGGLTLDNVDTSGGTGYYSGLLYTDKDLTLIATNKNNEPDATKVSGDIGLGSGAELYGSSVKIEADGTVTVYGSVTATGETADSTGDINITAGDVDVYGTLTTGKPVSIAGIEDSAQAVNTNFENVNNPNEAMIHISERFAHEINSANGATSNITINAGTKLVVGDDGKPILDAEGNKQYVNIGDGNVNLYFGNKEQGLITTSGNLTVTGTGDVYVDSDLDIGGDLTLTGKGANSEVVLDLTNIGQVQAKNELEKDSSSTVTAVDKLHEFMHHFSDAAGDGANINLKAEKSEDTKITVDMWDGNAFNLKKFDSTSHDFKQELDSINVTINGDKLDGTEGNHVKDYTYIWVSDGEQLQGINATASDDGLDFNYALKGDINASDVKDYVAIGTGNKDAEGNEIGFTGTFDGRGNRVIGLKVNNNNANAGIFSTVGENGVVKNVNIYSGNFTGSANAGAVAGVNNGRIENIVTFGNTVTATGENSNAGGIVGVNNGNNGTVVTNEDGTIVLKPINEQELPTGIIDVESTGSVIAGGSNAVAGGLVGTNKGVLGNSYSDSAVTSTANDNQAGLGGVVGVNTENGDVQMVDSLGVTNGGSTGSSNVGGVIGINNGNMYSGYNESIVSGSSNVGGIIGQNAGKYENDKWNGGTVENVVNATGVTGSSNFVGGLVGTNTGSVTNGRNNGTITGTKYVGGLVGDNADEHSILTNLVNDSSAEILGEEYVGGIAGSNSGTITSENQANLINRGSITGQKYVGGVAGENIGTIEYVNNDVSLNVKDTNKDASYFGGVAGINGRVDDESTDDVDESVTGTITSATNEGNVIAENASYVGGIVGHNTAKGVLEGMGNSNEGIVIGGSYVGGVIGQNDAAIGSTDKSQVGITNEGIVIAVSGGAGGLIGENNAAITNTIMTNKGEVHGNNANDGSGTGGLIGTNNENGDITYSSMINEVTGTVTGVNNVGGLIGVNKADIIGGRDIVDDTGDDKDSGYYVNKIYNNGVINVGTYTYNDKDGEYKFAAATESDNSTNVGGLFGTNSGKVEAAYNTGAINAENSTNVGGIAGTNSGTIDQVFNTVMVNPADKDQQAAAITGGNNVGGLIGTNSGTLSNAYNTTGVEGKLPNAVVGNAVGENTGANANVEFVYDVTNTNNKLIGENAGSVNGSYALQESGQVENAANGITYISADEANDKEGYDKFVSDTWKFYDGQQTPLLSVFLTKVKIDQDKVNEYMSAHKVYNGTEQKLTADDIKALIDNEAIYVEGLTKEQAFEAFYNNNDLISSIGYKDVGEHNNWLYSDQIAAGSMDNTFNPNNLGYDIELTASLAKKELSISDILANIVYGGNTYTNISGGSLKGIVGDDEVYLLDKDGYRISITSDLIAAYLSGDYATNKGNRNTADVKRDHNNNNNVIAYENAISVGGIRLGGQLSGNYTLAADSTISGDVTVTPADLKITLNDIYRIYGDHKTLYGNYEATQTGDYGIKDVIGLVNGDQDNLNELIVTAISDGALDDYANPTKTNDVTKDGYKWTGEFSGIDNVNSNYTITVGGGNSIVKAKTITIKDLLASIVYGNQDNKGLQINTGASLADGSIVYGDDVRLVTDNAQYTTGGAYEDSRGSRTTADVGEYTDSLFVSGLSLTGDKAENYVLDKTAAVGDIEVTKANLIINVGNAETVYGDAFNDNDYTHTLSGVTNGDSDTVIDGLLGGNYDNTVSVEAGKDTANAGTYKDALGFVNYQQLKNYDHNQSYLHPGAKFLRTKHGRLTSKYFQLLDRATFVHVRAFH